MLKDKQARTFKYVLMIRMPKVSWLS